MGQMAKQSRFVFGSVVALCTVIVVILLQTIYYAQISSTLPTENRTPGGEAEQLNQVHDRLAELNNLIQAEAARTRKELDKLNDAAAAVPVPAPPAPVQPAIVDPTPAPIAQPTYATNAMTVYDDSTAAFVLRSSPETLIQQDTMCKTGDAERCGCGNVFFLGGMKCGSTNLATKLKHKVDNPEQYDPASGFVDAGKEVCWARGSSSPSQFWNSFKGCEHDENVCAATGFERKFTLDACPYLSSAREAQSIACSFPNAKILQLVRDPIDRMVSHYNENLLRRHSASESVDEYILRYVNMASSEPFVLSNFGQALENFLMYIHPSQIMLVRTEKMHGSDEHVQALMDKISDFIGIPHRRAITEKSYVHSTDKKYKTPSDETIAIAKEKWAPYNEKLFRLAGFRFTWKYFPAV